MRKPKKTEPSKEERAIAAMEKAASALERIADANAKAVDKAIELLAVVKSELVPPKPEGKVAKVKRLRATYSGLSLADAVQALESAGGDYFKAEGSLKWNGSGYYFESRPGVFRKL